MSDGPGAGQPEKYTVEQVAAALEACAGINAAAANMLKCSPSTIANYIERYPELNEVRRQAKYNIGDIAESELVHMIKDRSSSGHTASVLFFLKTQCKDRGYVERVESTGKDGNPLVPAGQVTIIQLPDNERQPPAEPAPDGGAS